MNVRDGRGETPLHKSAKSVENCGNIIRVLIKDLGADVNAKDNEGATPLHVATAIDAIRALRALGSEHGADVGAVDVNGETPLHWAAKHNT